jgi:hypothetical protein
MRPRWCGGRAEKGRACVCVRGAARLTGAGVQLAALEHVAATVVRLGAQVGDVTVRHTRRTGKVLGERGTYGVGPAPQYVLSVQAWSARPGVAPGPAGGPGGAGACDPTLGLTTFNLHRNELSERARVALSLPYERHAGAVAPAPAAAAADDDDPDDDLDL